MAYETNGPDIFDTAMANVIPKLPHNRSQGELVKIVPFGAVAVDDNPATPVPATALAGRRKLYIQNDGPQAVRLGDSTVTATTGQFLASGANVTLEVGPAQPVFAVCAAGQTASLSGYEGY